MATENPLVQFVAYPLAIGACVGICLWVLLVPLGVGQFASVPEVSATAMPVLPTTPRDNGLWVKRMQEALTRKGYFIGPDGADGSFNGDTQTALGSFQDNSGLPMQPEQCDLGCWTELRSPGPKSTRP